MNTHPSKEEILNRKNAMLRLRYGNRLPVREIGKIFGISRQRVCQIIGNTGLRNGGFNYGKIKVHTEFIKSHNEMTNEEIMKKIGTKNQVLISTLRADTHHAIRAGNKSSFLGHMAEEFVSKIMMDRGIDNVLMGFLKEYDILARDDIRIDVKSATPMHKSPSSKAVGTRYHFAVRKLEEDRVDFYVCLIMGTEDVFIIPNKAVKLGMEAIAFSWPKTSVYKYGANWQQYFNRWDLIENFKRE